MRLHLLCVITLVMALASLPAMAAPWLIVAVPQTSGKDGQILDVTKPFQVVLTNGTLHEMTVWNDWSSQGYFNLSFEFHAKGGKIIKVQKNPSVHWFKHSPDQVTVQPGCAYSIPVELLSPKQWTGVETLHGPMTMRVIYQNSNKPAWVGQIKSDPVPVAIVGKPLKTNPSS